MPCPAFESGAGWLTRAWIDTLDSIRGNALKIACCFLVLLSAMVTHHSAIADDDLQVRLTWGGGQSRSWKGTIRVRDGKIKKVQSLGVGLDAPANAVLHRDVIRVDHWKPTKFGGADLLIRCDDRTSVTIDLKNLEDPTTSVQLMVSLDELRGESVIKPIDDFGNMLFIERPSFDRIDFECERPHLIFEPNEQFSFRWNPKRSGLKARSVRGSLKIRSVASGREVYQSNASFEIDKWGSAKAASIDLEVPEREGVYQLELSIDHDWFFGSVYVFPER